MCCRECVVGIAFFDAFLSFIVFLQQHFVKIFNYGRYEEVKNVLTNIIFSETGLPNGTEWAVDFGGVVINSTSTSIEVTGTSGNTHSYSIINYGTVGNYSVSPATTEPVTVPNNDITIPVTFTPHPDTIKSSLLYYSCYFKQWNDYSCLSIFNSINASFNLEWICFSLDICFD